MNASGISALEVRHIPGGTRDEYARDLASLIRLRGCSDPRKILHKLRFHWTWPLARRALDVKEKKESVTLSLGSRVA